MITEIILPKLGQTMEEGSIVEWVKQEGDSVQRGELLFTVESDKAVLDVEATARGFLRKILVPQGEVVPVLTVVGLITREADEDISSYGVPAGEPGAARAAERAATVETTPTIAAAGEEPAQRTGRIFASPRARKTAQEQGVDLASVTGTGPNGRIVEQDILDFVAARPKVTPVAAKMAEALGVDLATVTGTGPGGRITKTDVEAAAQPLAAPAEAPVAIPTTIPSPMAAERAIERIPVTGLRGIIAQRMAASDEATARVTLVTEADATAFVEVREQLKASVTEEWGFSPGYNDLLGIIVARALREFPYMNARLSQDGLVLERLPYVNLGMAVDTERGLLVPVIPNADLKGLRAFGVEFRELVDRARVGKSLPDDLSGGTFTITNLGMYDIDAFTPIINLPEAAILGAGRIQAKAVVCDGELVARQMWTLSLTFDHRLVDGAPAARFLQRIKQLVENPYLLLG
jgi:pyruvate dehydrogenase E2 component (dihydrolipoamide acetyltransferase)